MGKSKCAKSPISYLTTAPPEFETSKLLLKAVALAYSPGTQVNTYGDVHRRRDKTMDGSTDGREI